MKKRLKNLLALCMVAMMMFAMSTGVVSAETYYANMSDGGVYQYILDKNHGNDSVLYKGIPNNVTIAMNPGDIIVPFELTGGNIKSGGKYDDFCGAAFFIVTSVDKSEAIKTGLPSKYNNDTKRWADLEKVYQYDASSPFNSNKVTYQLNTNEMVDITALNGYETKEDVYVQKWNEAAEIKLNIVAYDNAYVYADGRVQDPLNLIPGKSVRDNNPEANGFGYNKITTTIGTEIRTDTYCDALKLPKCSEGYHYDVKKISTVEWDDTYVDTFPEDPDTGEIPKNVDNVPTGIKLLESASNEKSPDYSALVDTIFTYIEHSNDKYEYNNQCNTGLMIAKAPNTYTINFKPGNGGKGEMDSITKTYGKDDNLPNNEFTKKGYTFDGWEITEATYPDTIYQYDKYEDAMDKDPGKEDEKLIKDRCTSIEIDIDKPPYNEPYGDEDKYIPGNHNETVTMTAQWKANTYKVKFDANGGEGKVDAQSFTYDDKKQSLNENEFTRNGYTFTGWNTKADGTGTSYSDKAEVQNLTEKANDEVILYAQWDKAAATATGDDTNTMLPIALLMLSSMGIACIALNRKKHG